MELPRRPQGSTTLTTRGQTPPELRGWVYAPGDVTGPRPVPHPRLSGGVPRAASGPRSTGGAVYPTYGAPSGHCRSTRRGTCPGSGVVTAVGVHVSTRCRRPQSALSRVPVSGAWMDDTGVGRAPPVSRSSGHSGSPVSLDLCPGRTGSSRGGTEGAPARGSRPSLSYGTGPWSDPPSVTPVPGPVSGVLVLGTGLVWTARFRPFPPALPQSRSWRP